MRAGEYSAATALLADAASASSESGKAYLEALSLSYLGRLALAWGEYQQAREPLDRALQLIGEVRPRARILPLVARAQLARAEGEADVARRLLQEAVDLAREGGEGGPRALLGMGNLAADDGDRLVARELYEEALELARSDGALDETAQALDGLARLARMEGATRQAARFQREALRLRHERREACGPVESLGVSAGVGIATDRVSHAAQLVAAAKPLREGTAFGRPARVAASCTDDPSPPPPGFAAGGPSFAVRGGAALPADPAAVSNGGSRGEDGMTEWESLTDRERQVAELVADGLTNQEVADRLIVSLSTEKTHLEHVFLKLGISTRAELAKEVWKRGGTASTPQSEAPDEPRDAS